MIDRHVDAQAVPRPDAAASAARDFGRIEVEPGNRYFVRASRPFLVQGCSVARLEQISQHELEAAALRGLRVLRLWPDYNETNELNLPALRSLRNWCEQLSVHLILVLFSPGAVSDLFDGTSNFHRGLTPYNRFCDTPVEIVTRPQALDVMLGRCREILTVFEDSPALAAWEVLNEYEPLYDVPESVMAAFVDRLARSVRSADQRFGGRRLLTASSFSVMPPAWLLDSAELDFIAIHPYGPPIHQPTDRIKGALITAGAVRWALEHDAQRKRPVLDTESGIIAQLFDPAVPRPNVEFRAEFMHNLRWAHFASGAAGSGLHIAINDENLSADRRVSPGRLRWMPASAELRDMEVLERFWALAPAAGPVTNTAASMAVENASVLPFGSSTPTRTIGWLLKDTRASDLSEDISLALSRGPTTPTTLDDRLQVVSAWRDALAARALDPLGRFSHERLARALRRGGDGLRRGCQLVDESLDHLERVTRKLAPCVFEQAEGAVSTRVRFSGLPSGHDTLVWFDDVTGQAVGRPKPVTGPVVEADSPPFRRHLAFFIGPRSTVGGIVRPDRDGLADYARHSRED